MIPARVARRQLSSSKNGPETEKSSTSSEPILMPPPPPPADHAIAEEIVKPDESSRREEESSTVALEAVPMPPPTASQGAAEATPGKAEFPHKSTAAPDVDSIKRVAAEDLPSHKERQRWDLSKRMSEVMDELLPKLAMVTQKVNTYTGTDYSSIEALKQEIRDQGTTYGYFLELHGV
jgi:sensitive to high expression protein 9